MTHETKTASHALRELIAFMRKGIGRRMAYSKKEIEFMRTDYVRLQGVIMEMRHQLALARERIGRLEKQRQWLAERLAKYSTNDGVPYTPRRLIEVSEFEVEEADNA